MKKKIVLKVAMNCEKCRSKARKTASIQGVESIAIEGKDRDQIVVTGEGVDVIKLTKRLRKKVGYSEITSVSDVKEDQKNEEEKEAKPEKQNPNYIVRWNPQEYINLHSQTVVYDGAYTPYNPCSIL